MITTNESLLVLPDTHGPYHDRRCWSAVLKVAELLKPAHTVHVGDLADCADISFHERSLSRAVSFEEEIKEVRGLVTTLSNRIGPNRIFCEGNHERRLPRYLAQRCPEVAPFVPGMWELLGLKKNGWKWFPYGTPAKVGKMHFVHDAGHAGVTAVRLTKAKFQKNVCFGHTHRASVEYDGNVLGERHVGMSLGWLGDMDSVVVDYVPQVLRYHAWVHGFGLGYLNAKGHVHMNFIPIVDGECYVEGRRIRGTNA